VANNFNANPIYMDTDTTVGGNTNWKGTSGGSSYTGGIGIRPYSIVTIPLSGSTAGLIVINMINSTGGGTGPKLFEIAVPTAASTAATSQSYHIDGDGVAWKDFIVTGLTATGVAILIYYRV
jgi:hypothetical protein